MTELQISPCALKSGDTIPASPLCVPPPCSSIQKMMLQNLELQVRRIAFLDAATEVAGHWNDKRFMVNQYEQAQRSAGVLQRMALQMKMEMVND